jgi:OmpA-OmpF porin, OOP family
MAETRALAREPTGSPREFTPSMSWAGLAGLVFFGGLTAPLGARAQAVPEGFDAHGFQLAPHDADLRDPLVVQRPGAFSSGDFFLGGVAEYAESPLIQVESPQFGNQNVESAVLDNVVAMNMSVGVAFHDYVRVDAKLPVFFSSAGAASTEGPAPGDVRVSTMIMGVRPRHVEGAGGLGLAVIGHADLPTGTPDRFLGQDGIAGGARVAATYELSSFTFSGDVGTQFNPSISLGNLNGSNTLLTSGAIGVLASEHVGLTIEVAAAPPFEPPENLSFPAEALASLRYRDVNGAFFTLGGAAGLTSGPGVAAFRLFVGGGFGRQEPPRQPDFDTVGTLQTTDLCPLERETQNGWKDEDGCPDQLAAMSIDVRYLGRPWVANAQILDPDGVVEATEIGIEGRQLNAVPGTTWAVTAESDGCLYGEGEALAEEFGTTLMVNLEPRLDAHVLVEVLGPDDLPVETATVTWQSERPLCIPEGVMPVAATGVLEQDLSAGSHHITVTAPGHTVYEDVLDFAVDEDKFVQVRLDLTRIRIEKQQIVILEKVMFETAKSVIRPVSFDLLDEVAATIITNPDLGRVEVAGHTDSKGSDSYNERLSQERADSVKQYLIDQGVAAESLLAVGYGETKPLDTNKTAKGREVNRRVEFNLIDQSSVEESDVDGGPAPEEAP